jgi:hypothetical protein
MVKPTAVTSSADVICRALINGAYEGLSGDHLLGAICAQCPQATASKVAQATLAALNDVSISDPDVLGTLCNLAMTIRP